MKPKVPTFNRMADAWNWIPPQGYSVERWVSVPGGWSPELKASSNWTVEQSVFLRELIVNAWPEYLDGCDINGGDMVEWLGNVLDHASAVIAEHDKSRD